jgi:hypothetical protein
MSLAGLRLWVGDGFKSPLLTVKNQDAYDGLVTHGSLFGNLGHITACLVVAAAG